MESAEKEIVEFVREIVPADAQGLVEKWLLQVRLIAKVFFAVQTSNQFRFNVITLW